MKYAICIDFGSTYTKMVCVYLPEQKVIITDKVPSTVNEDASICLNQCFECARKVIGEDEFEKSLKLATSSAAGGLRIAVSGLTKAVSLEAGRNAGFNAGAKIVCNSFGIITEDFLNDIKEKEAEIILLCGGHENGNTRSLIRNAEILSESNLTIPVIYAGNSQVAQDIRGIFLIKGKECFLAENIIPKVGSLNTEPTSKIIRHLFMERIINMKGIGIVGKRMNAPILPTPAAVLSAGELLSRGTEKENGIGPALIVDIGGATTDVYSFLDNTNYAGATCAGSLEPYAKRTVEGDMGMRESSKCLINEVGKTMFARRCGVSENDLDKAIMKRTAFTYYIAQGEKENKIDQAIAETAVKVSARRHAGYVKKEFHDRFHLVQYGKNLTEVKTVIGTGGILVHGNYADSILQKVCLEDSEKDSILLPETIDALIDYDYILFAAGLLRNYDENAAFTIMKRSLRYI